MADNWNEQEVQALFRKHLPIKQMSPDFADRLKKQVLAEVAATLGPNPVKSVATEETNTNLVSPVPERRVQLKAPRSVAAPVATSWLEWLSEHFRLPSLTMVGATVLAVWALVLWTPDLLTLLDIGQGNQPQTSSSTTLPTGGMTPVDPTEIASTFVPTTTAASAVAMAMTATQEEEAATPTREATPQPATTLTDEEVVATPDVIVVTPIDSATTADGSIGEPASSTNTATSVATTDTADEIPGVNPAIMATRTPVATSTPTRILYAPATSGPAPATTGSSSPTPVSSRDTATPATFVPTNTPDPDLVGVTTPPATATRRLAVTPSATPLTLPPMASVATLMATRNGNGVLVPTLTPFEPTSTPSPTPVSVVLIPTSTPVPIIIMPWKSPTPKVTNTPLPTASNTPVATATRILAPTPIVVEPTLTNSPLPTVPIINTPAVNTPLPTATDTAVPVATSTRWPTATATNLPAATSTPAPTNTPAPTATTAPTNTPLPTATFTMVPTDTPMPTATFTMVPTDTPMPTATFTMVPTDTPMPTATPTWTETPLPTATPTAINVSPVIVNFSPILVIFEKQEYAYPVIVVDDGSSAALQFSVLEPSWLQFDTPMNGVAKLYGTPPGPGEYTVKIRVTDGVSLPAENEFTLTVMPLPLDEIIPMDVNPGGQTDPNPNSDVVASNSVSETQPLSDTTPSN